MSVWYCIPSKRPPEEAEKVLKLWRERGYKIALWLDHKPDLARWYTRSDGTFGACPGLAMVSWGMSLQWTFPSDNLGPQGASLILVGDYPGYARAVNMLVRRAIDHDPDADWFVTGGDDVEPDPNHAEDIARQCNAYFYGVMERTHGLAYALEHDSSFGVMQPTGDKWADRDGPYIERVAGSPWMGREFCRRMYHGNGPLYEGYFHMGEDEELQAVATMLGVFHQRPDLIHFHNHWGRKNASREDMPKFLERANDPEEWRKYKELFRVRKLMGFPGHEPLEA